MPRRRLSRVYDVAMAPALLAAVRARRDTPDGQERRVTWARRGGKQVASYPWAEMRLGDFFFVPLLGRIKSSLDVRLRQAAVRRDWELTIVDWEIGEDKTPGIRVTLSCTGVKALKKKAQHHHGVKGIRYSDGKWSATRAARFQKRKDDEGRLVPAVRLEPAPSPPGFDAQDEGAPLPVDAAIASAVETDVSAQPGYDRAAILRERLARLGAV